MAPWPTFVPVGVVVGSLSGVFGVGGSSLATPLLSLLGVPGLMAVASPLPAILPTAVMAAWPYVREGRLRPRAAAWTLLGGVPAALVGAFMSRVVGGGLLLVASGVVLLFVGFRVLQPTSETAPGRRGGE